MLLEEHCEGCARLVNFYRSTGEAVPLFEYYMNTRKVVPV